MGPNSQFTPPGRGAIASSTTSTHVRGGQGSCVHRISSSFHLETEVFVATWGATPDYAPKLGAGSLDGNTLMREMEVGHPRLIPFYELAQRGVLPCRIALAV